jgi:NADPH:quinone reductase-like Zn-dependent oxidoreductase
MKASVVTAYGGPEVMKYQDMPDPKPSADESKRKGI